MHPDSLGGASWAWSFKAGSCMMLERWRLQKKWAHDFSSRTVAIVQRDSTSDNTRILLRQTTEFSDVHLVFETRVPSRDLVLSVKAG